MAASVLQRVDDVFAGGAPVPPPAPARTRPDAQHGDAATAAPVRDALQELDSFIEREIGQRMAKVVSWKCLEPCFKWRRIAEYLWAQHHLAEDSAPALELRALLRQGRLPGVEYDAHARRVLRLNHGDL